MLPRGAYLAGNYVQVLSAGFQTRLSGCRDGEGERGEGGCAAVGDGREVNGREVRSVTESAIPLAASEDKKAPAIDSLLFNEC